MNSIRQRLLTRLLAGLAIGSALASLSVYYVARKEIDVLFDFALAVPDIDMSANENLPSPSNKDAEEQFIIEFYYDSRGN